MGCLMEREGPCSQELAERDQQGMQRDLDGSILPGIKHGPSRLSHPHGTTRGSCTKFWSCSSSGMWKIRSSGLNTSELIHQKQIFHIPSGVGEGSGMEQLPEMSLEKDSLIFLACRR